MLKVKMIPILARIISKIDTDAIITRLKALDVVRDGQTKFEQLTNEQKGILLCEIVGTITPQLGKIGDDIPEFVSVYKGISLDEAKDIDFIEITKEVLSDTGITDFFRAALQQKIG